MWCIVVALSSVAVAQSEPTPSDLELGKQVYANGARLYEEGLYEQAIEAFEESYRLTRNPKLLYNIANAQERLGRVQESLDTLNRYRVYATADETETLDRRLRSLERRIEEERAKAAATTPAPPAPAPAPEPAPAPVVVAAPVPVPEPPPPRSNTTKWVLLAGGTALATGFGTTAAVTWSNGRAAADAGDRDAYDGARALNNVAVPVAGVGAGLAVVAVALPSRRVAVAPGLGTLTLLGRF